MAWQTLFQPPEKTGQQLLKQISGEAKFLVDENLGIEVARVIRGVDSWHVEYAGEVGLHGKPDEDVFSYAAKNGLWILTHDRDFLNHQRFPFQDCPGVVVLPGANGEEPPLIRALTDVLLFIGKYAMLFPRAKIKIADGRIWTIWTFDEEAGEILKRRLRFEGNETVSEWAELDQET